MSASGIGRQGSFGSSNFIEDDYLGFILSNTWDYELPFTNAQTGSNEAALSILTDSSLGLGLKDRTLVPPPVQPNKIGKGRPVKICNTCKSTSTCRWYRDPLDSTKDRCNACYRKARGKAALQRTDKICNTCSSTSSRIWYKDPTDSTRDRCGTCYQKARGQRIDKSCSACQRTASSNWYKDPDDSTKNRCKACYDKAMREGELRRTDKTCNTCKRTSSKKWYKDPDDSAKDRCELCYLRAYNNVRVFLK